MAKPLMTAEVLGVDEAEAYLKSLNSGVKGADKTIVRVGTAVVYAWGIEFGQSRSGRPRRAAGGARMLTGALQAVRADIEPTIAAALPKGEDATVKAMMGLGYRVEAIAKAATPVRTGNLRRSLHTVAGPR